MHFKKYFKPSAVFIITLFALCLFTTSSQQTVKKLDLDEGTWIIYLCITLVRLFSDVGVYVIGITKGIIVKTELMKISSLVNVYYLLGVH